MNNVSFLHEPNYLSIWISNRNQVISHTTATTRYWEKELHNLRKLIHARNDLRLLTKEALRSRSAQDLCLKSTLIAEHRLGLSVKQLLSQPKFCTVLLITFYPQPKHRKQPVKAIFYEYNFCNDLAQIDSQVKSLQERIKYRYALKLQALKKSNKPHLIRSIPERLSPQE